MADHPTLQAQILSLLRQLGEDENPYEAIIAFMRTTIEPKASTALMIQLKAFIGLFLLGASLATISLVIRWRKGVFWVFRMPDAPRMIRPHATISWTLPALLSLILVAVQMLYTLRSLQGDLRPFLGYLIAFYGMPMFLAEIMAAWSIAVAYLLHLQSADAFRLARWSPLVNVLGPAAFILYTAASIPPAALSGRYYATAIGHYNSILEQMRSAAAAWQAGQRVDLARLLAIAPLAESAVNHLADYGRIRRAVSLFNCVAGAILVTIIVVVSGVYLRALHQQLGVITNSLAHTSRTSSGDVMIRSQRDQVIKALWYNRIIFVAVSSLGAVQVVSQGISGAGKGGAAGTSRSTALTLLTAWTLVAAALITGVLLILSARDAVNIRTSHTSSSIPTKSSVSPKRKTFGSFQIQSHGATGLESEIAVQLDSFAQGRHAEAGSSDEKSFARFETLSEHGKERE